MTITHPAKYTDALLPVMAEMIQGCNHIIDPFAGSGKIHHLRYFGYTGGITAIEIEPEYALMDVNTIIGNALHLDFSDNTFDGAITSPTYGNRMADHHVARDLSKRNTYRHTLNHKLHPDNSGQLQWGNEYREFHKKAWIELRRVLQPNAVFVLNCKNHIRHTVEQYVTEFHSEYLQSIGFTLVNHVKVNCKGNRFGKNGNIRIQYESILKYILSK